ncbi:MAG: hypothetical protein WBW88_17450, partial [Rhodothermales bacterium]
RSRLLRQAGLLLGDPLDRARALYPDASFFDRDVPFEQAAWEGVLQQINEVTPRLQSLERGMAFFRPYTFSEACLLARRLIAQVGLGPNKSVARIAAVRSAPGSVLQIHAEAVQRFLSHTNVSVLADLGFDEEIPSRLDLFGLTTLDKVGALTRRHLHAQFGAVGLDLFVLLHPSSEATRVPVFVPPAAITEVFAFDFSASNLSLLASVLNAIAGRAALRLGRFCCSRVTLRLSATDDAVSPRQARRILKNPTSDAGIIARAANYLLQSILASPFEASSIELTLSGLENPSHAQASLFFERPPLSSAIEHLEQRFPGVIRRAVLVRPDAPFPEDSVALIPFLEAS